MSLSTRSMCAVWSRPEPCCCRIQTARRPGRFSHRSSKQMLNQSAGPDLFSLRIRCLHRSRPQVRSVPAEEPVAGVVVPEAVVLAVVGVALEVAELAGAALEQVEPAAVRVEGPGAREEPAAPAAAKAGVAPEVEVRRLAALPAILMGIRTTRSHARLFHLSRHRQP